MSGSVSEEGGYCKCDPMATIEAYNHRETYDVFDFDGAKIGVASDMICGRCHRVIRGRSWRRVKV